MKIDLRRKAFGLVLAFLAPSLVMAQTQPAGVVTTLQGTAELSRPTQTLPTSLRFKDDIFVRNVINTKEKSIARVLFGGKSTVTVRELSRLEVREETLPGGATRSIHELSTGGILVNVAKQLMRPGDEVQIRTPNAVAAVRGTILFVECDGSRPGSPCNFLVLSGNVELTAQGRPPINLAANTAATVTGNPALGVQVSPVTIVAPSQTTQIIQQFEPRLSLTAEPTRQQTAAIQTQQASQLARAVVAAITGVDPGSTPGTTTGSATQTTKPATQETQTAQNQSQSTPGTLGATEATTAGALSPQAQSSGQEAAEVIQTALLSTTTSTINSGITNPVGTASTSASESVVVAPITPEIPEAPPPPPPPHRLHLRRRHRPPPPATPTGSGDYQCHCSE